jgi:hypothetical protein
MATSQRVDDGCSAITAADAFDAVHDEFGEPILTIELVPKTTWGFNLRSLLRPCHWDRLRKPTYAAAGYCCEICGGVGRQHPVECHEVWCFQDDRSIQQLVGLSALCPACHAAKHFGRAELKGFSDEILLRLAKVNSWSPTQVRRYVDLQYLVWTLRNRLEWDIDLCWLAPFKVAPNSKAWLRSCQRMAEGRW